MSDTKSPNLTQSASTGPVSTHRLKQIANDACTLALEKVETYEHSRTEAWNTQIINHILRALISESSTPTSTPTTGPSSTPGTPSSPPPQSTTTTPWKFAVNSTIIQHLAPKSSSTGGGQLVDGKNSSTTPGAGRRGMHSACGAYWNNERDGMWSYKYETKGMDVVISVIWIAV